MAHVNLRQIEAFRAVMITGSVTSAADSLAISQPAVSRLISDLEYFLGFSLFERRRGHAIQATEDAEALFKEVDKAFVGLDHLVKTAQDIQSLRLGHLRVVGPPYIANGILSSAAISFCEKYPKANLSIESRPHNEIVEMISLRLQDLAVTVLPVDNPAVHVKPLRDFDAVCAVPAGSELAKGDSINLQNLEDHSLISISPGSQIHGKTEQLFRELGVTPTTRVHTRNQESACHLVSKGKGVAILSQPLPNHIRNFEGIALRPISPKIKIGLGFLTSSLRPPSRMVLEFMQAVENTCDQLDLDH